VSKAKTNRPAPTIWGEFREWIAARQRLQEAEPQAEARVTRAEAELDAARCELAKAEAEALLRGDVLADDRPESQAFARALLDLEKSRAGLIGLRQRIAALDPDIPALVQRLHDLREPYNAEQTASFLRGEFEPMADAFAATLRLGLALEAALGVEIPDLHRLPAVGDWRENDTAASEVYTRHSGPREMSEQLGRFAREASTRQTMRERSRARRAGFDPSARYKVIKRFLSYGREFVPGVFVDSFKIDVKTLSNLYEARHLEPVSREEEYSLGAKDHEPR
jgi:hypothetical protein